MKKLLFILLMGLLMSFYVDAGRKPCSGAKGGSLTVLQAANLPVMMVLSAHRKKHALIKWGAMRK